MKPLRNDSSLPFFVLLSALAPAATFAAPAQPAALDTSSVLEMEASPEEKMIYGDLPAAPQSGSENPEDLLTSSPLSAPHRAKAAKKTADGMPTQLREIPGSKAAAAPRPEDLPPAPLATEQMSDAPAPIEEAPAPIAEALVPAQAEGTSARKWDRRTPLYERESPTFGFDLHGSLKALGDSDIALGTDEPFDTRNFGFGFEWQPKFLQSFGVLSIGPSANLYVVEPVGDFASSAFSIFSLGGSVKYQLRYFDGQWVVPFVGFEAQMIRYSTKETAIGSGWTTATGPTLGAMLLLNWIEPSAAYALWSETSIKRSYLVGEFKMLTAGEPTFSVDGKAIYFGLRMEY